jgi:leader peptidase (prepilin peptidase) / N-methyltransferase
VIFRLPAGLSVISPPSRCPICGSRLTWRENFPILGWLMLRGRCRRCGVHISAQYMVIELLVGLLFAAVYLAYFVPSPSTPWWGEIGGPWWAFSEHRAAPAFAAVIILIAGLVAMTAIDARTFTIPIEIPTVVAIVAFVAWAIQGLIRSTPMTLGLWPIPTVGWTGTAIVALGLLGLVVSFILLKLGVFRYSFADYNSFLPPGAQNEPLKTDDATAFEIFFAIPLLGGILALGVGGIWVAIGTAVVLFLVAIPLVRRSLHDAGPVVPDPDAVLAPDYPHARREMLIELLYLSPCLVGIAAGWLVGPSLGASEVPQFVQALAAAGAGYLVGGGLVWGIRIFGTLAFGREAMGIGDVHMLAAVGAVLGWEDPIWIFFLAAFVALGWTVLGALGSRVFRGRRRELPFGPHLALATLILIFARPAFNNLRAAALPGVPPPPSRQTPTSAPRPFHMPAVPKPSPQPGP